MTFVLNTNTNTIHESAERGAPHRTTCGALRNVSSSHVRVVGEGVRPTSAVARCGRCFDDGGGY